MNIGKPLLLLLLFVGACTTDSHSPNTEDVGQWQQTAEKLTTLLKEEKFRETENMTKIKLSELLGNVNNAEENDTLIKYAREILTISYYNYLKSKQIVPAWNIWIVSARFHSYKRTANMNCYLPGQVCTRCMETMNKPSGWPMNTATTRL